MQSQRAKTSLELSRLYERDLFEWSRRAAETLRGTRPEQADTDHLAEEIEDMGIRDLQPLDSRLEVLLAHLVKSRFQPEKRSSSWEKTVAVQRKGVARLLKKNPSLRRRIKMDLAENYEFAVRLAVIDTGLPKSHFPAECPFTVEQILGPEFLP
jgi:hypothetical protein